MLSNGNEWEVRERVIRYEEHLWRWLSDDGMKTGMRMEGSVAVRALSSSPPSSNGLGRTRHIARLRVKFPSVTTGSIRSQSLLPENREVLGAYPKTVRLLMKITC